MGVCELRLELVRDGDTVSGTWLYVGREGKGCRKKYPMVLVQLKMEYVNLS